MTTKYARLLIKTTPENHTGIQKILFKYNFKWNVSPEAYMDYNRNYSLHMFKVGNEKNLLFKCFEANTNLYRDKYGWETLILSATELDKIVSWLEADYKPDIKIKEGQDYIIDGDKYRIVLNQMSGKYHMLNLKTSVVCVEHAVEHAEEVIRANINSGNWKLV